MKNHCVILLSVLLFSCRTSFLFAAPNTEMIAKVKSGAVKEARASWWGFSADDATKCLQSAIDSKVPKLIIDRLPNTWNIEPIRLVSNQEIVIEEGVKIAAKRNSFQNGRDCLFTLANVTNVTIKGNGATLRMYRDDYANPPYNFSLIGDRHAFHILSSSNVTIDGLTILHCGGDAFHLGAYQSKFGNPCSQITIRNCKIEKSCSRGIYVSSTIQSTFEDITIQDTAGRWPNTGITICSECSQDLLQNVLFKKISIQNCKGYAIGMSAAGNRGEKSNPITVAFDTCNATACDVGIHYSGGSNQRKYARGKVIFNNCVFSRMRRHAVKIIQKPRNSVFFEFKGGKFEECCTNSSTLPDVDLSVGRNDDFPVDDIMFNGVDIYQGDAKRNWLSKFEGNWIADDIRAISGKITIHSKTSKKNISLDSFWRKANFPVKSKGATPSRVTFVPDPQKNMQVDTAKGGAVPLSPLKIKGSARFVFFAEKGRTVHLKAQYLSISKQRSTKHVIVRPYGKDNEKPVADFPLPDFLEKGDPDSELIFDVPDVGFYSMDLNVGHNGFIFTSSDVPIAIDMTSSPLSAFGTECTLYFPPARGKPFAVFACGDIAFEVCQPNGTVKLKGDKIRDWSRFLGTAQGIKDLWSIKILKPEKSGFGEYQLDITGMPAFLFLSNRKYWRSASF